MTAHRPIFLIGEGPVRGPSLSTIGLQRQQTAICSLIRPNWPLKVEFIAPNLRLSPALSANKGLLRHRHRRNENGPDVHYQWSAEEQEGSGQRKMRAIRHFATPSFGHGRHQ